MLRAQLVPELEGTAGLVGVEDELDDAGAVAQVDEDQAAVVAAAVNPAGDADLGADPVGQHLAAPRVAVSIRLQRRDLGHRKYLRFAPGAKNQICTLGRSAITAAPL